MKHVPIYSILLVIREIQVKIMSYHYIYSVDKFFNVKAVTCIKQPGLPFTGGITS